jgi:hypothetical protein
MKAKQHTTQRRFWLLPLLLLIAGVVFSSCYEDYGLTTADYDTYLTHYAPNTNFQKFKYYVMPDTIIHLYDTTGSDPLTSARKFDKTILDLTHSNLNARGYVQLTLPEVVGGKIDSTLVVLIAQATQSYTGYYYSYWGYYGWYYPYYPYYPPAYGGSYDYSTGSTVTTLMDFGQTKAQNKPVPVWTAIVTGLTGSPSTAQSRLATGINKTFEQSPYLYAGQ